MNHTTKERESEMSNEYGITRGPWKIGEQDGCYADISSDRWTALASVVVRWDGHESNYPEGEANARAIAEVPNMIEALRKAHGYLRVLPGADDAVLKIDALLARIRGNA